MNINRDNFQETAESLGASRTGGSGQSLKWAQFCTPGDARAFLELCKPSYNIQNVYPSQTKTGKAVIKFF